MKYIIGAIVIAASIFINWNYKKTDPMAGIGGFGMKKEIKNMVREQQKLYVPYEEYYFVEHCIGKQIICDFRGKNSKTAIQK